MDVFAQLTEKEIESFDRLLAEACLERVTQFRNAVLHWDRKVESTAEGTAPHRKYCEWRDAAAEALAVALRRESTSIASLTIKCEDPHCEGHRALLIGVA